MTLLLDTSILIDLERLYLSTTAALNKLTKEHPGTPMITFINQYEFIMGTLNRAPHNRSKAIEFISRFPILNTTRLTGAILAQTKESCTPNPPALADLIIATIAIENDLTLVTRDKDFSNVKELKAVIL